MQISSKNRKLRIPLNFIFAQDSIQTACVRPELHTECLPEDLLKLNQAYLGGTRGQISEFGVPSLKFDLKASQFRKFCAQVTGHKLFQIGCKC